MRTATDDQAARIDLGALIADGFADIDGRLRHRFLLEGVLAAAVQLERAGVSAFEVASAAAQLRADELGLEPEVDRFPSALQDLIDLGRSSPDAHERILFVEWLDLCAGLMRERAGF